MAHPGAPTPASRSPAPAPTGWPAWLIFALLFAASFTAYLPALSGTLLWDDAGHLTAPALQSLSGLGRIWFEPGATQQYYPLLHSAFWLEHQLWGDHVLGYHLVNVLWHALAATLFVTLLRRLAVPGALLAGLVFTLHPVCVESVAWISEQKNTLSLVFYLAAALAWLRYEDDRRPARYVGATLWFAAALLTKTVTATLPAALLVLAWWRRGRVDWRTDVRPLLLWLALGVSAGLGTAWFEATQIGAAGQDFALGPIERTLLASRVVWFYFSQLVWPDDLAFFYPRWTIDATAPTAWLYLVATLALLAFAGWRARRDRSLLAAALLFGGTLFPVLGFVNVYPFLFSYVADHFQYHACLALIALLCAAAVCSWERLRAPRWSGPLTAAAVLALAGFLTWQQAATYRDVFTLYEATLRRSPDSWVAHLNLGSALVETGRPLDALPHLQRANELKPDYPDTLNSLGDTLNRLGRAADALPHLRRAVQLHPRFALAHNSLGVSLMALNDPAGGVAAFRRALELDPRYTLARVNLGWALANTGQPADALAQLALARRADPTNADAEFKTALVHAMTRRIPDALPHAQRAVELAPDNADMRNILGVILLELGRNADAESQFEMALEIAPGHPGATQGLAHVRQLLRR